MNDDQLKRAIDNALKGIPGASLASGVLKLLAVLGYASAKRISLEPNTPENFLETFSQGNPLSDRGSLLVHWKSVDFLFQLTDEEIRESMDGAIEFDSKGQFNGTVINSYLFFAVELRSTHYSRSALASFTRDINRLFEMPVLVVFRYGDVITLAVINRRVNKRDVGKDVLERVTLIQDIRCSSPHRAHIEILFDLSFFNLRSKFYFTNFIELHAAWQRTLDTSALNRRFFQDLANWYFWALKQAIFPEAAPKDTDGNDALSLIRLITRLIFCWFLKEKGLLPEGIFDPDKANALLIDSSAEESTYYKAILQNLFFATLNQEMGKRGYREELEESGDHNFYRYSGLLKDPPELSRLLANIPFMNGGLFDCLDEVDGTEVKLGVDGFSDDKGNVLELPNDLFFGDERLVDLSNAYGDNKYESAKVAGLISILNRYKFTVAENTPIEEEVALDPELLGKVFENLLASYNPETGATARKQTGSFYTPREIVDYMVDESLIASVKSRMEASCRESKEIEPRLRHLFAYNDGPHQFTNEETDALIGAIDSTKILDPACGSGAFPMGVLHKLVFVLKKLDPGNGRWRSRQVAKAREISDPVVRERVVADIEQTFGSNELDYGRKLYLIENCIYGVDIQPIAVQISKLRFFISLVVDQKVNKDLENLGIRPLPNLETRFVAANTLMVLDKPAQQMLRGTDIDAKEAELKQVRERHFLARTPSSKAACRNEDSRLRFEIAEMLERDGWDLETSRILSAWDPYDQNLSAVFFDLEWMFGMTDGFDVVIGNPPYVDSEQMVRSMPEERAYLAKVYSAAKGNWDLYIPFWERSLQLSKKNGGVTHLLTPNKWLSIEYGRALRKLSAPWITRFSDYSHFRAFENTGAFPVAVQMEFGHRRPLNVSSFADAENVKFSKQIAQDTFKNLDVWGVLLSDHFPLIARLVESNGKLSDICYVESAFTVGEAYKVINHLLDVEAYSPRDHFMFVNTGTIDPFSNLWSYKETKYIKQSYLRPVIKRSTFKREFPRRFALASTSKILISGMRHFEAYWDEPGECVAGKSTVVVRPKIPGRISFLFLLGILNSKLTKFFLSECYGSLAMDGGISFTPTNTSKIPAPMAPPIASVEKISATAAAIASIVSSDPAGRYTEVQYELDQQVYSLYGLSAEEIRHVERSSTQTEKKRGRLSEQTS